MRKTFLILILAVAALAANSVMTSGVPYMTTHPQPPVEQEFYWDDGVMANAWAWYTGGNYWGVSFSDKTEGNPGWITAFKIAGMYNGSGCYFHIFGTGMEDLYQIYYSNYGSWQTIDPPLYIPDGVFLAAMEQIGNYPYADAIGADAVAGTHNWTCYNGSWGQTTAFGDFMIRCLWNDENPGVEETSWGAVKTLY